MINQPSKQIQDLIDSSELYDDIESIGNDLDLHIDQVGELYAEIIDILRGINKSADFTKHIQTRLEIDAAKANQILKLVNTKVFDTLRSNMQTTLTEGNIKSVEQAGNFSIEKESPTSNEPTPANVTPANKAKILNDIEFPISGRGTVVGAKSGSSYADNHTEPLVDQLLSMPTTIKEDKVLINNPVMPTTPPKTSVPPQVVPEPPKKLPDLPPKPKGPDLYREPIK